MDSSEYNELINEFHLHVGEDLDNDGTREEVFMNIMEEVMRTKNHLDLELVQVMNDLLPKRECSKRLKLEYQSETDEFFKLKGIVEKENEIIADCHKLFMESEGKVQNIIQNEITYMEKGEIDRKKPLNCCKNFVHEIENKIEVIKIQNKHNNEQKDLEIATIQKPIYEYDELSNQNQTEETIKIRELEEKILLLNGKIVLQNEEMSKAAANENEVHQLKILDKEEKLQFIDLKEKTDELNNLQNKFSNLKNSKEKEDEALKEKLQYLMKRVAENQENLNKLTSEDANLTSEIVRLDTLAETSAQRKKELEQNVAEKNSLIEEAQNTEATLEKKYQEEVNILTKNNEDLDLQVSNVTKLKEEIVLRIKENNEEQERSLQEEYSIRGEIEVESNNSNMMKAKTVEQLKKKISLEKTFTDLTVKLNTLNLQLAERKKDFNKKISTFHEELNKINEDTSYYKISSEKDLNDLKEKLEAECKGVAEDFEAFEKSTLEKVAQLTKSIESQKQNITIVQSQLSRVQIQLSAVQGECERYKERIHQVDKSNSKQRAKLVTYKRILDKPRKPVADVDSDTSMSSIGRPTIQDILKDRKLE